MSQISSKRRRPLYIRKDEYAVVDKADRDPQIGEYYLFRFPKWSVWQVCEPWGKTDPEHQIVGIRKRSYQWDQIGCAYYFDGNISAENLRPHVIGRVVGVLTSPDMSNLLPYSGRAA